VYLEADFTGTPYKDKMFKNGTILKNGVPLAKNIGLRYNASKDKIPFSLRFCLKEPPLFARRTQLFWWAK